ncbi:MAG: glycosyltransferase family 2 protein [Candidatus Omnitrophica bacterium]|jgi:dolichol-phosphate mannosyltransferase|nr:glycosyltransferase family 2 protein [Candidatus Omnitrophota bacterium]
MKNSDHKLISVVTPLYNEEEVISQFYDRLIKVLSKVNYNYELILVDDGSSDKTLNILENIANNDKNVKIISFSRNFGHMMALSAGLDYSKGDAVITIDSDLQHPPELIPKLLQKWEEGNEIVNTLRIEAKTTNIFKKLSARFFYFLMNRIANTNFQVNSADYRLLDRVVVENIKSMKEHSRFLRGLINWVGYKQDSISYQADRRQAGKTKYSFWRMFSFAIDGITSFSSFPLRLSTYLGLIIAFFSFIYILRTIYIKLIGQAAVGWASVLTTVLFMGGVQLIFLGVIGEYLARVYEETKERPLYIVKKKIGF